MQECRNLLLEAQLVWTKITVYSLISFQAHSFFIILKEVIIWFPFLGSQLSLKSILRIILMKQCKSY